jgi:hypothetical protein
MPFTGAVKTPVEPLNAFPAFAITLPKGTDTNAAVSTCMSAVMPAEKWIAFPVVSKNDILFLQ